jgi:hypothetical protein
LSLNNDAAFFWLGLMLLLMFAAVMLLLAMGYLG